MSLHGEELYLDIVGQACYNSYCMRFHFVIFITLVGFAAGYLRALDRLGVIHLHGAPSLHAIGSFDEGIWLGESHFSLVG